MPSGHPDEDAKQLVQLQVRIDINHPSADTTPFPMRALLLNLLKELQKVHPTNAILPIDDTSTAPALTTATDLPLDDAITQYFGGFQDAPGKAQ